jgi:hypothetical protein
LTQLECDVRDGGEEKADVLPCIIHLPRVICAIGVANWDGEA